MAEGAGLMTGQIVFPLAHSSSVIGRTDRAAGIHPHIDLSPLGGDRVVSRRHAEVLRRGGNFFLRDLGSRAGTFVNGEPLMDREWALKDGDTVTIGTVTLRFSSRCHWPDGLVADWEKESSHMVTSTQLPRDLPLIAQLPTALKEGKLLLHFQPQVLLSSGDVPSVEALIRWPHPQMGMVPPERYMALAEESGFVTVVTAFAIKEAAKAVAEWKREGANVAVAINLSVMDLEDVAFGEKLVDVVKETGTSPSDFVLEVTESAVMYNPGVAIATLHHLKSLGFTVAIDDFGTGRSSLAYLMDLPAHEVKLDKSFSIGITSREEAIVLSAVQMAHSLGITVVAEGVEDEATARFLIDIGCDKAQGYFFGEPGPRATVDLKPRSLPSLGSKA